MRRLRGGARVLDAVGVLRRVAGGVEVRPAWSRAGGWTAERDALAEMLTEREVAVPW